MKEIHLKDYYTLDEVSEKVKDFEEFWEYANGMNVLIEIHGRNYYLKKIVDMYVNR
jgi:translation initiation factor IF-3